MPKIFHLAAITAVFILIGAGCASRSTTQTPTDATAESAAESVDGTDASTETEDTTDTAKETATITYTDEGYSPAAVTVKKGGTVTFVNESSTGMWPASAVHPTHRAYPTTDGCLGSTFDACRRVEPGDSWTFSFDIPGRWRFHNHLTPTFVGSITVE